MSTAVAAVGSSQVAKAHDLDSLLFLFMTIVLQLIPSRPWSNLLKNIPSVPDVLSLITMSSPCLLFNVIVSATSLNNT